MIDVHDILLKSRDEEPLIRKELIYLLGLPPDAPETYLVMAEANRISKELTGNKAEVHAQLALNLAPCSANCKFCSFARVNKVFKKETRLTVEQAVAYARQMKEAGFAGVYHALRLREGVDSGLLPADRKQSIYNFYEADLLAGTCVEPVGTEHTNAELAKMILYTASINPAYSGAARRIPIPGTELSLRGTITELRMAQIVAVTRLGMPRSVMGNCTHEPCALGGLAGANLFWAEAGANPRNIREKTEEGRGQTVDDCRTIFAECNWNYRKGPSSFYD